MMQFSRISLVGALLVILTIAVPASAQGRGCPGKPGAPVDVSATLNGNAARVRITLTQQATNVSVHFHGTDGLTIRGNATPVEGRSCVAGEALPLDVDFVPGSGYCLLVVSVTGTFQGQPATRVISFAVGARPARLKSVGPVQANGRGESVQELPATTVRYRRATP